MNNIPQNPQNEFNIVKHVAYTNPSAIRGEVLNEEGDIRYGFLDPRDKSFHPFIHDATQEYLEAVEVLNPTILYNVPSPAPPLPNPPPPRRPKMYD